MLAKQAGRNLQILGCPLSIAADGLAAEGYAPNAGMPRRAEAYPPHARSSYNGLIWGNGGGPLRPCQGEGLDMKRVWIAGAVMVGLAAAGIVYQTLIADEARSQTPARPSGAPAVPVVVTTVKQQPMPVQFEAVGTVQTIASVAVKSRVDGQIAKVLVKDGQTVKAGETLMLIDPRLARAQLDQAEAQLARDRAQQANAYRDVGRYKPLAEKEFVSRQQLDTSTTTAQAASASVRADEAAVESAQVTLSYFTITAPIDGRIGYINQKIGNNVKANDVPLATINQIKPIYVSFPLPQADLPAVRDAMAAGIITASALPVGDSNKPEQGRLTFFENSIDSSTGTILMRATFDNPREGLWPGQFCNVTVRLSVQADALTIPSAAVQVGQRGEYVYVVTPDNRAKYRPVTVSRAIDGTSVIAKGLAAGERVVTDGILRITDGSHVAIRNSEGAPKSDKNS
jgi:multidrug efflux system membrane fusion protein